VSELTYFAQIDANNVCLQVHVVTQEFIDENSDRYPGVWVETYFNNAAKTYAGEGYIYNSVTKDFTAPPYIPPSPVTK
jgi:hypothetical protein